MYRSLLPAVSFLLLSTASRAGEETHDNDEIEANITLITPSYARRNSEAETSLLCSIASPSPFVIRSLPRPRRRRLSDLMGSLLLSWRSRTGASPKGMRLLVMSFVTLDRVLSVMVPVNLPLRIVAKPSPSLPMIRRMLILSLILLLPLGVAVVVLLDARRLSLVALLASEPAVVFGTLSTRRLVVYSVIARMVNNSLSPSKFPRAFASRTDPAMGGGSKGFLGDTSPCRPLGGPAYGSNGICLFLRHAFDT
ncbi:hypothetical protein BKA59DRAFT_40085 [Fusarium tricinctum]|uniref:Secreted protein n=1 Tax=Fusarium tricinctum TaxID=61284 RepID=A0A8K0S7Z8_9HYPO|nr:hypothetical protein BKA59DRAFT_40085 [Fusarium tricinctum]